MKKTLIALALLLLTTTASAQDTIVLKNGSRFLAKILDIDAEGVHYKIWTNLDGPTWTKSFANIRTIKREGDKTTSFQKAKQVELDFSKCGTTVPVENKSKKSAKNKKEQPCMSGNDVVRAIDSIYNNNSVPGREDFARYINGLPTCIQRQCIENYYLEQFEKAVASENENDILRYGETYLYVGAETELPRVVQAVALIYASRGNEQAVNTSIDRLKGYSIQNDNMLDEDISKLQKETYALLHPRRLEDDMRGKWVLLEKISNKGMSYGLLYSPLILEIKNVGRANGANLLLSQQDVPKQRQSFSPSLAYNRQINTSQALLFDGNNRYAAMQFASLVVKDRRGNTDLAHSILESNRDTRAKMNATIASSKASIEDKLAASIMTGLYTGAVDALARSMNTSSKTDEVYNFVLFPKNDNVMNAYVSHVSVTTTTTERGNPTSVYNDYIKDKKMQFVRWEESDSIFFVSANRRPVTLNTISANDPLLNEYWQIREKHSLRNPRYFVPMGAGSIIGFVMIRSGVKQIKASEIRDIYGNRMQNPDGSYMNDDKMLMKGIFKAVFGGVLIEVINLERPMTMVANREKAYMDINRRNIEKLRQKARATVAVAPTYEPQYNTFGANINLSF